MGFWFHVCLPKAHAFRKLLLQEKSVPSLCPLCFFWFYPCDSVDIKFNIESQRDRPRTGYKDPASLRTTWSGLMTIRRPLKVLNPKWGLRKDELKARRDENSRKKGESWQSRHWQAWEHEGHQMCQQNSSHPVTPNAPILLQVNLTTHVSQWVPDLNECICTSNACIPMACRESPCTCVSPVRLWAPWRLVPSLFYSP